LDPQQGDDVPQTIPSSVPARSRCRGQQLRVNQVSSMVWGWVIGAAIVSLLVIGGIGFGLYVFFAARGTGFPAKAASLERRPFACSGNDTIALPGVTATAGVVASSNCELTLTNVSLHAPVAINARGNAKVTVGGGSATGDASLAIASGNATITFTGSKVSGKDDPQREREDPRRAVSESQRALELGRGEIGLWTCVPHVSTPAERWV
jgi:hypothetical protein